MLINKKHVRLQRKKMQELWVNDSLNLAGRELIEELLDAILELLKSREIIDEKK